jgi:hypothetical protein
MPSDRARRTRACRARPFGLPSSSGGFYSSSLLLALAGFGNELEPRLASRGNQRLTQSRGCAFRGHAVKRPESGANPLVSRDFVFGRPRAVLYP